MKISALHQLKFVRLFIGRGKMCGDTFQNMNCHTIRYTIKAIQASVVRHVRSQLLQWMISVQGAGPVVEKQNVGYMDKGSLSI